MGELEQDKDVIALFAGVSLEWSLKMRQAHAIAVFSQGTRQFIS